MVENKDNRGGRNPRHRKTYISMYSTWWSKYVGQKTVNRAVKLQNFQMYGLTINKYFFYSSIRCLVVLSIIRFIVFFQRTPLHTGNTHFSAFGSGVSLNLIPVKTPQSRSLSGFRRHGLGKLTGPPSSSAGQPHLLLSKTECHLHNMPKMESKYRSLCTIPENTRRWTNVDSMLAHRWRRWTNIKSTLVQRSVFAVMYVVMYNIRLYHKDISGILNTCTMLKHCVSVWAYA